VISSKRSASILRIRRLEEALAKMEWARTQRAVLQAENELEGAQGVLSEATWETETLTANEVQYLAASHRGGHQKVVRLGEHLGECQQEELVEREIWQGTKQRHEGVERLHDKAVITEEAERLLGEQNLMDDVTSARFNRR
jgi:flagellar export protein FliJ